jgi:RNA polymerase sigma-70 factor (ECF subfamily)
VDNALSWTSTARPENYEALLSPHLKLLEHWVRSRVRGSEDADDVVQQTLLLAWRHIGQFRFEASVGTWLCRIAINVIRARYRRPDYSRTVFADPKTLERFELRDPGRSPLAAVERSESDCSLHRAISKLPDFYREVVELRDLQGLTLIEAANQLGITKPALKSRHHRARNLLSKLIDEQRRDQAITVRAA